MDAATTSALIAEATRKSGLIWVRPLGEERIQPVWHVWHEGAAYVLSGGSEQPLAGAEPHGSAEVSVRSKDNGARLVVWEADVSHVPAESEEWQALAPQLLAKRLNTPDGEAAPARWARECTLVKLVPTGRLVESPDAPDTGSGALPPPPTPAATRVPVPFTLGRRQRWRQR